MPDWWNFSRSMGQVFACRIHALLETVCLSCVHVVKRVLGGLSIVSCSEKKVVVLHAFIKKSQQSRDSELKMARKRLKEVKNG